MTKLTTTPTSADLTADNAGRTITGLALPYGPTGRTSAGPVNVAPGAISLPADLRRVKLFRDHSNAGGQPVGFATAANSDTGGLTMSFRVGPGPDGDQALADAAGVRDALSVELSNVQLSPDRRTVISAQLSAVALVPVPAFDDARVTDVTAAQTQEETPVELNYDPAPENGPAPVAGPEPATASAPVTAPAAPAENGPQAPQITAAAAPVGLPTTTAPRPMSLDNVTETLHAVRQGDLSLTAALADITRSANPWVSPDGWVGEVWDGVAYQREIVPLLTRRALTHWKASGWRWVTKPTVGDYAGDKTEIPTNPVATELVSVEASRLAGGHDLDRKFWDFNDHEFIRSYWAAMAESYAVVSDQRAATFVTTNAAPVMESDGVTEASEASLLKAVARGIHAIKYGPRRARATFALVNPDDYLDLMDITDLDVPAWLELFAFTPNRLTPSELVPAGKVIVGAKPAATFYELGGSPIRVEAVELARGGRDAAVFGYYATLLNDDGGLVSVNYTPAP
ncbi:hypothetical protein [Nocardia rhizosphaerae]|uniref:Uncharacterized protein n=1 Tax=Nocardia rhizosphaerae TaxID=1691571 RepID=A0ABV8LAJ5_9NOCA